MARDVSTKFARLQNLANDLGGSLQEMYGICAYNVEASERRLAKCWPWENPQKMQNISTKIGGVRWQKWQFNPLEIEKFYMGKKKKFLNKTKTSK